MLGAIAGDIIGSVYEHYDIKRTDFELFDSRCSFTDDTVLTVATAYAILHGEDYGKCYRDFGRAYPDAGYGGAFIKWLFSDDIGAYNSWGNGSAMRVSPVGFAFDSAEEVLEQAGQTARVTHNHPEGIKGAQATALSVFLAGTGEDKQTIRDRISGLFGYNLQRTVEQIRPGYRFDVSCQGTVPEAITAFLDSEDFEDAVRKAISLGGDSDTIGCITGGIAHAFYRRIPERIVRKVRRLLPDRLLTVLNEFENRYMRDFKGKVTDLL